MAKEYSTGELVIIWKPELCEHAGICVQELPKVYDPDGRPWIRPENATAEQLIAQIELCPSRALTYRIPTEV